MATAKPSQPKFCTDCRHSFRSGPFPFRGPLRCRLRPFPLDLGAYLVSGHAAEADRFNSHWPCASERTSGDCGPEAKFFEPRK
jgi:hypothetical protein